MSVRIPGLPLFRHDLHRVGERIADTAIPAQAAAHVVSEEVRGRAKRKSGALAASIRESVVNGAGVVTVDAVYGGVIEGGWRARNIQPQPYVVPGAEAAEPQVGFVFEQANEAAVDLMRSHY